MHTEQGLNTKVHFIQQRKSHFHSLSWVFVSEVHFIQHGKSHLHRLSRVIISKVHFIQHEKGPFAMSELGLH